MHSSSQTVTTNKPTPNFLQAGCPSCHPTNRVRPLNEKVSHSTDLLTPRSSWVFLLQNFNLLFAKILVTSRECCQASHQPSAINTAKPLLAQQRNKYVAKMATTMICIHPCERALSGTSVNKISTKPWHVQEGNPCVISMLLY